MKKIVFISLLIGIFISCQNSFAQQSGVQNLPKYDQTPYHFGFVLSVNQMNFQLKTNPDYIGSLIIDHNSTDFPGSDSIRVMSISTDPTIGFTIGIVSNLRLGNHFDLRFIPSLAFGERRLVYSIKKYDDEENPLVLFPKSVNSTLVDLPLNIKFKSKRYHNMRAYLLGGIKYTLDLHANKKNQQKDIDKPHLRKHDFMIETGVGFDFYTVFFKFGIEAKMSYGLNEMLIDSGTIYADGISSLKSKIFQISLTFE